ncbi:MAG TPA: septum formation initiator family protein [Acidimicrobiales bacterium]|nr:septum formation initiator family protein [Acidimicrobiales bacterium]
MRPRAWLLVACMALAGVLFLAAYPARAYLAQNEKREELAVQVHTMEAENQRLEQEVQTLQSDAEIERLARRDYNLVRPGEEVYAVVPEATTTTTTPAAPPPKSSSKSLPGRAWDWVTGIF